MKSTVKNKRRYSAASKLKRLCEAAALSGKKKHRKTPRAGNAPKASADSASIDCESLAASRIWDGRPFQSNVWAGITDMFNRSMYAICHRYQYYEVGTALDPLDLRALTDLCERIRTPGTTYSLCTWSGTQYELPFLILPAGFCEPECEDDNPLEIRECYTPDEAALVRLRFACDFLKADPDADDPPWHSMMVHLTKAGYGGDVLAQMAAPKVLDAFVESVAAAGEFRASAKAEAPQDKNGGDKETITAHMPPEPPCKHADYVSKNDVDTRRIVCGGKNMGAHKNLLGTADGEEDWKRCGCISFCDDFNRIEIDGKPLTLYGAKRARLFFKCLYENKAYGAYGPVVSKADIRAYLEKNNCKVPESWTPSDALKGHLQPLVGAYDEGGTRGAFRISDISHSAKPRSQPRRGRQPAQTGRKKRR